MAGDKSVEVIMTERHAVYGTEREIGEKVPVHPSIADRLIEKKVAERAPATKSLKVGGKSKVEPEATEQGPEATE